MKQTNLCTLLCAALCLTALPACSKSDGSSSAAPPQETTTTAETTLSSAETTTTAPETTSAPETTAAAESETTAETTLSAAQGSGAAKLLWSERGLEAVPADSTEGYGEPLAAGAEYLGWTLNSYSGTVSEKKVSELKADFTYDGTLSVNGILTILPASDADNPNGLYLRVDNQAEFPYFPADQRDRGYFIIENASDVYEWLELDKPPVSSEYTVAVTVGVTALRIDLRTGGYDKITVTSASRR